ncbi:NUDIX hydrolase [Fulvitalea axinellae]
MLSPHPRNVLKYCPKCGKKSFVYQENDSLLCDACGFRFYINSSAAVAVLITDKQGRLLLTRRKFEPHQGMLDLPGGFVDVGETGEEACIREIKEELALDIEKLHYKISVPNEYVYGGVMYFTLDLTFHAEIKDLNTLKAHDDVVEALFFSPEDINLNKIGATSIRKIVQWFIDQSAKESID